MRALSIRQPYAELILRGIKTIEYRSRATTIVGERFYIYAAKAKAKLPIWSDDLRVATPPTWMIELARQVGMIEANAELPVGVIVGSAVIERAVPCDTSDGESRMFQWELGQVKRLARPRKPTGHPQPSWFEPF